LPARLAAVMSSRAWHNAPGAVKWHHRTGVAQAGYSMGHPDNTGDLR
jgi:hypothetical protein